MDLLQTVRKEGSRGGVDFKWEDVRNSNHRENYLGHSLMAPVGRWQKGRDLNWYAKGDNADKTPEDIAREEAEHRKEELRKVKEAEEDAMAKALGLPVPDRSANTEPLGERKFDQEKLSAALNGTLDDDRQDGGGRHAAHKNDESKRSRRRDEREHRHHRHRSHERGSSRRRRYSRSTSRTRESRREDRRSRRYCSRSGSRERRRHRSRDRERGHHRDRSSDDRGSHRRRSRSPYRRENDRR